MVLLYLGFKMGDFLMICIKCKCKINKANSYCENCGAFLGKFDDTTKDWIFNKVKSLKNKFKVLPIQVKGAIFAQILVVIIFFLV